MVALQPWWPGLRAWMRDMCPILAAAVVLLASGRITSGLRLLPMPYFPSPAGVLQSLVNDRALLFDSTWHSLILLVGGYALGVFTGLDHRHLHRLVPARALLGNAGAQSRRPDSRDRLDSAGDGCFAERDLFRRGPDRARGLVSGHDADRFRHLQHARLVSRRRPHARRRPRYLIFRVAIPAAMPNIFIGLFMGLGASFLTLIVAETVGVKSGLGWYVQLGAGLGGIRKGLCRAGHHGGVLFHHHDAALQGARPRARLAKRGDQVVAIAATEASSLRVREVSKSFPAPDDRSPGDWPWTPFLCRSRPAKWFRSSARAAAANPRCCA